VGDDLRLAALRRDRGLVEHRHLLDRLPLRLIRYFLQTVMLPTTLQQVGLHGLQHHSSPATI
jgi:hypothetical protein